MTDTGTRFLLKKKFFKIKLLLVPKKIIVEIMCFGQKLFLITQ